MGLAVGCAEGVKEGKADVTMLGFGDGSFVGITVGSVEGGPVGDAVGSGSGLRVGAAVGQGLGITG